LIPPSQPDDLRKISAASNTNISCWLFAAATDLCRLSALAEAHGSVKDAESPALWKSRRDGLLDELERLDIKARNPSAICASGATP